MPSIARSTKWFVRVSVPHTVAKSQMAQILDWKTPFGSEIVTVLAATHVGEQTEKEHFHMVLELTTDLQKQSLDCRLKQLYGVKGADYSSKPWDGSESACSYLFHDENCEIIANKGHTDEDIARYRKLNADVQKVVAVNKSRASGRHVNLILDKIRESGSRWTRHEVLTEFVNRIRNGEMYDPGDFQLKRYIEEIHIHQLAENEIAEYVADRYFLLYKS